MSGGKADIGDVLVLPPLAAEVNDLVHPSIVQLLVVTGRPRGDDAVPVGFCCLRPTASSTTSGRRSHFSPADGSGENTVLIVDGTLVAEHRWPSTGGRAVEELGSPPCRRG